MFQLRWRVLRDHTQNDPPAYNDDLAPDDHLENNVPVLRRRRLLFCDDNVVSFLIDMNCPSSCTWWDSTLSAAAAFPQVPPLPTPSPL